MLDFKKLLTDLIDLSSEASSSIMKIYNSDDNLKNYMKNPTNTNQNQKEVFDKILNIMKIILLVLDGNTTRKKKNILVLEIILL